MNLENIKNIVFAGLKQGWSKDNIIGQIKYLLVNKEEIEILWICGDDSIPEITTKAEEFYEKYREEYYHDEIEAVWKSYNEGCERWSEIFAKMKQ